MVRLQKFDHISVIVDYKISITKIQKCCVSTVETLYSGGIDPQHERSFNNGDLVGAEEGGYEKALT